MESDLSASIYTRIRERINLEPMLIDENPSRYGVAIGHSLCVMVVSAVVALIGFFVLTLWRDGDPLLAERLVVTINSLSLQVLVLLRIAPAFAPPQTKRRALQRILPIAQRTITGEWFSRCKTGNQIYLGLVVFVACCALIAGANPLLTLTNVLWQFLMLIVATRLSFVFVSRCGKMGWISTIIFWTYAALALLGMHATMLTESNIAFAIVTGPSYAALVIPTLVADRLGYLATLGIAGRLVAIVGFCIWRGWKPLSPTHSRLRKICRNWRTLPDHNDPTPGNLNYPRAVTEEPPPPVINREMVARTIRTQITCPSPRALVKTSAWRRLRGYSIGFIVFHMSIMLLVDLLHAMNQAPVNSGFAVSAFVIHLPAMWGIGSLAPLLNSRLVNAGNLVRVGVRGLAIDTLLAVVILLPGVFALGRITGDFTEPTFHLCHAITFAALFRIAWIPLLKFRHEAFNLYAAFLCGWGSLMLGGVMVGTVANLFGWAPPQWIVNLPLIIGASVAVIGWDRIAARIHHHLPELSRRQSLQKNTSPADADAETSMAS